MLPLCGNVFTFTQAQGPLNQEKKDDEATTDLVLHSGTPENRVKTVIPHSNRMGTVSIKHIISEKTSHISLLTAVSKTFFSAGEHVVDVDQREHGEGSDERAGLDGDAAPQQGGVTRLVKQSPDHHLHVGEKAGEDDPGDDL